MKNKETLEEAAFNFTAGRSVKEVYSKMDFINGAKFGAKWQQEKMYSEEEVIAIVEKSRETGLTAEYLLLTEKFKKK
jgi:hypothetical protein